MINSFDEKFDSFWNRVKGQYEIIGVRDRQYLNWRYRKPGNNYEVIVAELAGEIIGYIVIKTQIESEHIVGYIVDILIDKSLEASSFLIKQALLRFLSKKVDYVLCWMMKDISLYNTLRNYGFIENDVYPPINATFYTIDKQSLDGTFIGNPRNWYLTMGDTDSY